MTTSQYVSSRSPSNSHLRDFDSGVGTGALLDASPVVGDGVWVAEPLEVWPAAQFLLAAAAGSALRMSPSREGRKPRRTKDPPSDHEPTSVGSDDRLILRQPMTKKLLLSSEIQMWWDTRSLTQGEELSHDKTPTRRGSVRDGFDEPCARGRAGLRRLRRARFAQ